jgi:two-component system, OmpR family, response regulator QseB
MRLLLLEDEADLAAILVKGLHETGFTVDHVTRIDEAEDALAVGSFDVVVLDRIVPDGDSLELLRNRPVEGLGCPVLMLTARDALQDRLDGLEGGADDYLLKPFHFDELVARLRALLRRPNKALGVKLISGNIHFDTPARSVQVAGEPLVLSRRELALLELLMRRMGSVVTKEVIETTLYNFQDEIGQNAIEVLLHRLRRRLVAAGATAKIHTLRGIGYMLDSVE